MSNTIYIKDIASIEQLRVAIARFCDSGENKLSEIDSKIQSRLNNLKNFESGLKIRIEDASEELRSAQKALRLCETGSYDDDDDEQDCSCEEETVINCRKYLQLTEHQMQIYKKQIHGLEKVIAEYQNPKIKFRNLLQFEKDTAISSLKQLINGAEDYMSVSGLASNPNFNGLGLADAIAKVDPTLILAATAGFAEIVVMSVFSFISPTGKRFSLSNEKDDGFVTSVVKDSDKVHQCSKLKIEKRNEITYGKIIGVNIPSNFQNERVGKYFVQNMEGICRENDCKEISGWATPDNLNFYKNLNYQTRNEIKDIGTEVFKPLESNFNNMQHIAKTEFKNFDNADFIKSRSMPKQEIDPLNIITPAEINDHNFWEQHGEDQARYIDLIEKYDKCIRLLQDGMTLDDISKKDLWVANAYRVFHGSEPVRLQKSGTYYRLDGSGRHRVAAAQMYYLQTGVSISIIADVTERI